MEWPKYDCKEAKVARDSAAAKGLMLTNTGYGGQVEFNVNIMWVPL